MMMLMVMDGEDDMMIVTLPPGEREDSIATLNATLAALWERLEVTLTPLLPMGEKG